MEEIIRKSNLIDRLEFVQGDNLLKKYNYKLGILYKKGMTEEMYFSIKLYACTIENIDITS